MFKHSLKKQVLVVYKLCYYKFSTYEYLFDYEPALYWLGSEFHIIFATSSPGKLTEVKRFSARWISWLGSLVLLSVNEHCLTKKAFKKSFSSKSVTNLFS